jgi:hypothetical protein
MATNNIDFSFLFSTIDMTWTVSRMVFIVTDTQTVRFSVWTSRSTVVFLCRSGAICSLGLFCFSAIDRGLASLGMKWDGRRGVMFGKGIR